MSSDFALLTAMIVGVLSALVLVVFPTVVDVTTSWDLVPDPFATQEVRAKWLDSEGMEISK